ncbi:MAG: OB-fold domain-containing protein, partial [Cycloclasticus sp.]|nr:OB-fold domain-containing protein [Cycloclasticus sp.]
YTVALVELDEGPRVMGHIETKFDQEYKVGSSVRASYKTINNKNELLYFQVQDGDK